MIIYFISTCGLNTLITNALHSHSHSGQRTAVKVRRCSFSYFFPSSRGPLKPSFDVKLQSLNVRISNNPIKRRPIFVGYIIKNSISYSYKKPVALKNVPKFGKLNGMGRFNFSHGSSHSKGVMTLVNPNLDFKVEKCIQDTNGRFLVLDLLIDELHLILVNIYAPNDANQQVTFFKELENQLEDFV